MNFISTAINTAKEIMDKVESQEEIDRLGREVSCLKILTEFIGETVGVQFDHDNDVFAGTLRFDGQTEDWTVGPVDEVSFRCHWLDAVDIDLDGSLMLVIVIPPDELEELRDMEGLDYE